MCLKDLKDRFARVDIHVSAPLVAFKESAFLPAEAPDVIPRPLKVKFRRARKMATSDCIVTNNMTTIGESKLLCNEVA